MPRRSQGIRTNAKHKPAELPAKVAPGFVDSLDGRSLLARALRQRFEAIATDLGGESELSALKASLLERLVWLEAMLGKIETDLAAAANAADASKTLAQWIQAVNSFTGIAKTLGLERSMRDPWAAVDAARCAPASAAPVGEDDH
jgi:hypothetical protein